MIVCSFARRDDCLLIVTGDLMLFSARDDISFEYSLFQDIAEFGIRIQLANIICHFIKIGVYDFQRCKKKKKF
jgi:hypothetical protein